MKSIPVDRLQQKTDWGFQLKAFDAEEKGRQQAEYLGAHRDDHYIFFILLEGAGSIIVDFEEKTILSGQLYYLLPEQIHYRITTRRARGWFIATDPSLIDPVCRNLFESWAGGQDPVTLTPEETMDLDQLLQILNRQVEKSLQQSISFQVCHSLLRSFFEMAASVVRLPAEAGKQSPRPVEIARRFKQLLGVNIRTYKSPSDYAGMLHISEAYLNESLKKVTGSPVSFWIKYKTVTEAKRLLYYTDLTVKQIAAELSFRNQSYFSRLFRMETGTTPLTFRQKFKKPNSPNVIK
jgi:AraC-like DNA-binding protein